MEQPPQQPQSPGPQSPQAPEGAPLAQEPPGGWNQPITPAASQSEAYAVKRSLGRCWLFSIVSFGVWGFVWFYRNRKLLDGELGHGRDDAALHTAGLFVPILNFFIIYWLWRDLDVVRRRVGLAEFPVVVYVVGAIFLAPVPYSLVVGHLNEYWDARTQRMATEAPVSTGEKIAIGVGAALFLLWLLVIILTIVVAVVAGSG